MNEASNPGGLEEVLGYRFQNQQLLLQALVHRSYIHETAGSDRADNETLEFLGDAVLGLTISHLLLKQYPNYNEGDLSRLRSSIVNERELARIASDLDLGNHLVLGKGEEMTGGRRKQSLLADTLEAILGAVYLDGGLDAAMNVVGSLFHDYLYGTDELDHPLKTLDKDYKTQLQELLQARYKMAPNYVLESEEGPDHDKTFHVIVSLAGRFIAGGTGKSKKDAQQVAAREALERMSLDDDELEQG